MSHSKDSSSSLESILSSLETYLVGVVLGFTFLLLSFVMRKVCFSLLRLRKRDLLEEEEEP
jgi:hypothetical protein